MCVFVLITRSCRFAVQLIQCVSVHARARVAACASGVEERKKERARPCVNEEGEVGVSNPVPV